jgi:hypothetical protein
MSINDWDYVSEGVTEEDLGLFTQSLAGVLDKKSDAYRAIDALIDSAGESWFAMGENLERKRVLDLLDTFEHTLVDSEEDAKMALYVLREMISNATEESTDRTGN